MTEQTHSDETLTTPRLAPGPAPRMARRATVVVVTAAVTLVAITGVLAGRAALRSHWEETRSYAAASDVPAHNGLFVLPLWGPGDATDLAVNVQTQGKGRSLTLTAPGGWAPAGCLRTPHPEAGPVPGLDLGRDVEDADGWRCGEWFVVRDGDRVWAWTAYGSAA